MASALIGMELDQYHGILLSCLWDEYEVRRNEATGREGAVLGRGWSRMPCCSYRASSAPETKLLCPESGSTNLALARP
jgi:hypothetical protein